MKKLTKKAIALILIAMLAIGTLAACGSGSGNTESQEKQTEEPSAITDTPSADTETPSANTETKGGKLLFLTAASSGPGYDFNLAYLDMWTKELGYTYEVVYGDPANDPAGNLAAVKKAMTSDVVGLIIQTDGGVVDVMTEYPDLYVVGNGTDMASVYSEGGASAACADNVKFLGTIAGGFADGNDTGKMMADAVIEKGYKSVAIVIAPAFAYPQYTVADKAFRAEIESYNETSSEKIEVVDDEPAVVMFRPLDDTFFNEPQHQDLDVVIGFCAGQAFIYPVLANAIGNGTASPDTKLLTFGMENDQSLIDDVGTGIVQGLYLPNFEGLFFSLVMLDNAIQGNQFADFTKSEVIDGPYVDITSDEIMTNIEENSPILSTDLSKLALSIEDGMQYITRYNPDATYAKLVELMYSDTFTKKGYEN